VLVELEELDELRAGLGPALDALLLAVESRVERALRPGDVAGRRGAGRFRVVCEHGEPEAQRMASRIGERLAEPFRIADREIAVRVRIRVLTSDDAKWPAPASGGTVAR